MSIQTHPLSLYEGEKIGFYEVCLLFKFVECLCYIGGYFLKFFRREG